MIIWQWFVFCFILIGSRLFCGNGADNVVIWPTTFPVISENNIWVFFRTLTTMRNWNIFPRGDYVLHSNHSHQFCLLTARQRSFSRVCLSLHRRKRSPVTITHIELGPLVLPIPLWIWFLTVQGLSPIEYGATLYNPDFVQCSLWRKLSQYHSWYHSH